MSSSSIVVFSETISIMVIILAIILFIFMSAFVGLHAPRLYIIIISILLLTISYIASNLIQLFLFPAISTCIINIALETTFSTVRISLILHSGDLAGSPYNEH